MDASWGAIAPAIAIVTTITTMQVGVVLTGAIRRRDFRLFEDKSRDKLNRRFGLPLVDSSPSEERRKSLSPFLDKAHQTANGAQTTHYNAVVRSAGCLALAFLALAVGTLSPEDFPLGARLDWPSVELALSWIDAIAILSVLLLFLYGRMTRPPWIASRTATELLRQYQILSVVFPGAISATPGDEIKTKFETETDLIAASVQEGPNSDIVGRIERFWSTRKVAIENHTLTDVDLTADALVVYLQRRVRRQLGWFTDSKGRLEHIAERRKIALLSLYCLAAGLAVFKLALVLCSGHSPVHLLRVLLVVTGLSAAMTAYYINQNSRSLIHRYNTQQRIIARWLATFNDRWPFVDLLSLTIDLAARNEIRTQILWFEDLMIEELIDWVNITSHDAMELAP